MQQRRGVIVNATRDTEEPSPIGRRLAEAIEARGIIPAELARRSKVDHSIISRILKPKPGGKHKGKKPDADNAARLARALGIRIEWLLFGNGPRDAGEPAAEPISSEPRMEAQRSRPTRTVEKPAHYSNLERALEYWGDRWSSPTIAAAREISHRSKHDPTPQEWTSKLDQLEAAIRSIFLGEGPAREDDAGHSRSHRSARDPQGNT